MTDFMEVYILTQKEIKTQSESDPLNVRTLVFTLISQIAPDNLSNLSAPCFVAAEAGLDTFYRCY